MGVANCADINSVGTTALGRPNRFDSRIRTVEGDRPYKPISAQLAAPAIFGGVQMKNDKMTMAKNHLESLHGTQKGLIVGAIILSKKKEILFSKNRGKPEFDFAINIKSLLRRKEMKKFILVLITIACITVCSVSVYAQEVKKPEVNAHGAIIMDYKTGRVLWGKNENEPMSMASTTKIMTAIIALENGNMDDMVTVSKRAAASPDVQMNLVTGEKIKLKDLMYALMYTSYNDAAVAIAEHVGGTVEDFCKMMTDKAHEIGAVNTIFETPSGLDKGDHRSTAYDMALIAKYALDNKEFMELIQGSEKVVKTERREYYLVNKNRLLREFSGANGMKTGFTNKAGHCFVGTAKRDDMQLITVVLASGWGGKGREQKWVDTKRLLNYGFENFEYKEIIVKDEPAGNVEIFRSKNTDIPALYSDGLVIPMNKEEIDTVSVIAEIPKQLKAPVALGDILGMVKVYLGDELYTEIPIIASEGAERHDLKTSLEKVISQWLGLGTWGDVKVELPEF